MKICFYTDALPGTCLSCPMRQNYSPERYKCRIVDRVVGVKGHYMRPLWCPLQQKEENVDYQMGFKDGKRACLDELMEAFGRKEAADGHSGCKAGAAAKEAE